MSPDEAKPIIEALANGIDPESGEILPSSSVYNQPEIIRALFVALKALEKLKIDRSKKDLPANVGKAWSEKEDCELIAAFENGSKVKELSLQFGRTTGAISSRLARLGYIK